MRPPLATSRHRAVDVDRQPVPAKRFRCGRADRSDHRGSFQRGAEVGLTAQVGGHLQQVLHLLSRRSDFGVFSDSDSDSDPDSNSNPEPVSD